MRMPGRLRLRVGPAVSRRPWGLQVAPGALRIGLFYVCVARAHHFIVSDVDFRMSYVYVVVVLTVVRAVVLFLLELLPNHNRTPPIDIRRKQDPRRPPMRVTTLAATGRRAGRSFRIFVFDGLQCVFSGGLRLRHSTFDFFHFPSK